MKIYFPILLIAVIGGIAGPLSPQTTGPTVASSAVTLSDQEWKKIVTEFEDSVLALSKWLANCTQEKINLQNDIEKLEQKIADLRQQTQKNAGVFDEIRLKSLLNDLKEKLEKNSELQHQWDEKQKEFEQKTLSLVSLYNDRINGDLEDANLSSEPSRLNFKLNELALLIRKRNQTKALLKQYENKTENEKPLPIASFKILKSGDRESLLLALDLIRDQRKDLEEHLEKWSIEEEEVKNELKLQGKMQEFLEDIQRMNEDSSFPHSSLKRNDLGDMAGNKQRKKLEDRLAELQDAIDRNQKTMSQLDQLMAKVQRQLASLSEGESK